MTSIKKKIMKELPKIALRPSLLNGENTMQSLFLSKIVDDVFKGTVEQNGTFNLFSLSTVGWRIKFSRFFSTLAVIFQFLELFGTKHTFYTSNDNALCVVCLRTPNEWYIGLSRAKFRKDERIWILSDILERINRSQIPYHPTVPLIRYPVPFKWMISKAYF